MPVRVSIENPEHPVPENAARRTPRRGGLAFAILTSILTSGGTFAQTFEVASVKVTDPKYVGPYRISGGPGSSDPERVVYRAIFLNQLVREAYDVQLYQVIGPSWMSSQRYDIVAKVPAGATREEYRLMLQALLRDRLALSVQREQRKKTVFELIVARRSNNLKVEDGTGTSHSLFNKATPAGREAEFKAVPISRLAAMLQQELGTRVIDSTGLTQFYSFTVSYWYPGRPPSLDATAFPSLEAALKDDLGLELKPVKGTVEYLVIEHVERQPTAD
jgi:uncharacterized protein (TIGR03435 family)